MEAQELIAWLPLALALQAPAAVEQRQDDFAAIDAEIRALPGSAAIGVYALEPGGPRPILAVEADRAAPVGSSFKLWVLAEAMRQVRSGTRRWRDVVALGPPALPSGMMQRWPAAAPVTLQTLATMMIAISDNTAADTLVGVLGRERIEAALAVVGVAEPRRTLPLLTTREAAVIKADASLAAGWAAGGATERRALLARHRQRIATATLDPTLFDREPRAIDAVEWFASPADMARTLDWLRRRGDRAVQQMLAINPGLPPAIAGDFAYVGSKGGSEPGVIALNYLLATNHGRWFVVAGTWHRNDAPVDEAMFAALMARAAALTTREPTTRP